MNKLIEMEKIRRSTMKIRSIYKRSIHQYLNDPSNQNEKMVKYTADLFLRNETGHSLSENEKYTPKMYVEFWDKKDGGLNMIIDLTCQWNWLEKKEDKLQNAKEIEKVWNLWETSETTCNQRDEVSNLLILNEKDVVNLFYKNKENKLQTLTPGKIFRIYFDNDIYTITIKDIKDGVGYIIEDKREKKIFDCVDHPLYHNITYLFSVLRKEKVLRENQINPEAFMLAQCETNRSVTVLTIPIDDWQEIQTIQLNEKEREIRRLAYRSISGFNEKGEFIVIHTNHIIEMKNKDDRDQITQVLFARFMRTEKES